MNICWCMGASIFVFAIMAVLQPGYCELVDEAGGSQWLVNLFTGQQIQLPEQANGRWQLVASEEHPLYSYLNNSSEPDVSVWPMDKFSPNIYSMEDNLFVAYPDKQPMPFNVWGAMHESWATGIPIAQDSHVEWVAHHFRQAHFGYQYWWTVKTLVSHLVSPFLNVVCDKIVKDRIRSWTNMARQFYTSPMRRAKVKGGARLGMAIDGEPLRCLAKLTMCTGHMVVIVLSLAFRPPETGFA